MEEQKAAMIKITAIKNRVEFETSIKEIVEINESYKKISSPFYSYVYERIEQIRENKSEAA